MNKNILDFFLTKLCAFPLWVKQVLFIRLHDNLLESLSEDFITTNKDDIFHVYVPDISYMGSTELGEKQMGYDTNFYNFLDCVSKGMSVIEIAMSNYWTMEEVSKYFVLAMEQNYIKTPTSKYIISTASFLSGKFRTAEYFKHVDKINIDQLREVVNKQEEERAAGNPIKIAELMIQLGFVTEKDCRSLLVIKEEAKQRFILDSSVIPDIPNASQVQGLSSEKEEAYKQQIAKMQEQNKLLVEQQKKMLAYIKKIQGQNVTH